MHPGKGGVIGWTLSDLWSDCQKEEKMYVSRDVTRGQSAPSPCCHFDQNEEDIPLVFRKPSWQLRATLTSVLITPLLYRLYSIVVTIGWALCSSSHPCTVNTVCSPHSPVVDLSWTGLFPCNIGWRGSAVTVAILSAVFVLGYSLIIAWLARIRCRRQLLKLSVGPYSLVPYPPQTDVLKLRIHRTTRVILAPALNMYLLLLAFHLLIQSGDVESNPGPVDFGTSNYKYAFEAMVACGEKIVEGLSRDHKTLALSLHTRGFISESTLRETNELNEIKSDKARRLYSATLNVVKNYPHQFENFMSMFYENKLLFGDLIKELEETYERKEMEEKMAASEIQASDSVIRAKPGDIDTYKTYLKGVYSVNQLPADEKYPLDCVKHYINLECADARKHVTKQEAEEFRHHLVRGDIESIPKERITIDQVATKQDGRYPKLVFVKGAPGVGKTTLSWELCRRWSTGKLLMDYSLVVLLLLRDSNVQRAVNVADLFQCGNDKESGDGKSTLSSRIEKEMWPTQGEGVLFILEGLDELPESVRQNKDSIFMALINGQLLPASTVLVTTRPWAISDLVADRKFQARIDQNIEILGFNKQQISEYIDSMIRDGVPGGLRTYTEANPHISSAMYNPLQARIVVEVYREYSEEDKSVFPNTTTELYTAYSTVVIQRYLTDHSADQEWNGDLSALPTSTQVHFNSVCKIAHDGIIIKKQRQQSTKEEQQLVFFKEDVPKDFNHLGFMNSVQPLHRSVTKKAFPSFNFLHFTLQEYLAAIYIWKNDTPHQQMVLFESERNNGVYKMILRFLAGLTKFEDEFTRAVLPCVPLTENILEGCQIRGKVCDFDVDHIQWLYESQNSEVIASFGNVFTVITVSDSEFNAQMLFALGYCLAASTFQIVFAIASDRDLLHSDMVIAGAKKCLKPNSAQVKGLASDGNFLFLPQLSECIAIDLVYLLLDIAVALPNCFLDIIHMSTNLKHVELCSTLHKPHTVLDLLKDKPHLEKLVFELRSPHYDMLSDLIASSSIKTLVLKMNVNGSGFSQPGVLTYEFNLDKLKQHHNGVEPLLPSYVFDLTEESLYYEAEVLNSNYWLIPYKTVLKITAVLEYFKDSLELFGIDHHGAHAVSSLGNSSFPSLAYEGLENLFLSISSCTALRELHLPGMGCQSSEIGLSGVLALKYTLSKYTYLQILHITDGSFIVPNVCSALENNSSITKLVIKEAYLLEAETKSFADMIRTNTSLQHVEVELSKQVVESNWEPILYALESNTCIRKFRISLNTLPSFLRSAGGLSITSLLETNMTLECLELPFPLWVGNVPLFQALAKNVTLQTLKLTVFFSSNLKDLSSKEITALSDMLIANQSLQILHLVSNIQEFQSIFEALAMNRTLLEFGLSHQVKRSAISCPLYVPNRQRMIFLGYPRI